MKEKWKDMENIGDLLTALRALEQGKMKHDIYVDNKLRKKFLLEHNNKFTSSANIHEVQWENAGSGVWRATI